MLVLWIEPKVKPLLLLEPDLIIASPRPQKFVDRFNEIAPTVLFKQAKMTTDFYQDSISNP